jgi:AbrB family looped-hinge helix DNA binding protein
MGKEIGLRISSKGQITIPAAIRKQAGLLPHTEVNFEFDGKGTAGPSTSLRSPGFPVELDGVGALHAAFRNKSSTRSCVRRCVAGNPGPVGMTICGTIYSHSSDLFWEGKR